MSFTGEVKQELSRQTARAGHCRIAELTALLYFCGTVQIAEDGRIGLLFQTEQQPAADVFLELLRKCFQIRPEQAALEQQPRRRTGLYRFRIEEQADVVRILQAVSVLDDAGELQEEQPFAERPAMRRECCRRAFLRGAFLAAGMVSDPNRSYQFELICGSEEKAVQIRGLLESLGVDPGLVRRGRSHVVYEKEGGQISDLLGMMGAHVAVLNFENARILREMRGNINRQVNCETANIRKTADAAAEQIEAVRFIEREMGWSGLSPALREIGELRVKYPTATLKELGAMLDPPVGKSGVNHRLRRLCAIAGEKKRSGRN